MKKTDDALLYMQLYDYYKDMILSGLLKPGVKLPSVRKCADSRQVSRTTVEMAYMLLAADGYIVSKPQSGFFVTEFWSNRKSVSKEAETGKKADSVNSGEVTHVVDFSNTSSGTDSFDLERWRRYVKSALRQGDRLLSYGDEQGEFDLRKALCEYLQNTRNVVCTPESIVIGAGFQSLLHILCPLLSESREVYLSDAGFSKGQAVFEDYGFLLSDQPVQNGIWYLSPSHMNRMCQVMELKDRFTTLARARQLNCYIIEDDYDSEFINASHPVPSIQGLDGGQSVIYLGTFSRILVPSIRISFMILPPQLLKKYEVRKQLYNQTVSKADQIALCQFIRDGHLSFQIRKTRKAYEEANQKFMGQIEKAFTICKKQIRSIKKSGLVITVKVNEALDVKQLHDCLLQKGIRIGLPYENGVLDSFYLAVGMTGEEEREESLKIIGNETYRLTKMI